MSTEEKSPKPENIRELRLDQLCLDADTQTRAQVYEKTVREYAEIITDAGQYVFPPVTAFEDSAGRLLLADGFHRFHAAKRCELELIPAIIKQGERFDAFRFSLTANNTHGRPRTNADKRWAVKMAVLDPAYSDLSARVLAEMCAVHHDLVVRVREALKPKEGSGLADSDNPRPASTVRGIDGKRYQRAKVGKKGTATASTLQPSNLKTDAQARLPDTIVAEEDDQSPSDDVLQPVPSRAIHSDNETLGKGLSGEVDGAVAGFGGEGQSGAGLQSGFCLCNGEILSLGEWDDLTITRRWTQRQLDRIRECGESADSDRRVGQAAVLEQQKCVVDLARTFNRFLSQNEPSSQTALDSCIDAADQMVAYLRQVCLQTKAHRRYQRPGDKG